MCRFYSSRSAESTISKDQQPINKRSLRTKLSKPNYSDEKRKSPRNLNNLKTAKNLEISQKTPAKKKSSTATIENAKIEDDLERESFSERKKEMLAVILSDINSKISGQSFQAFLE